MISFFASFRAYALSSLLLTTAIITHAAYTKRFFYRAVVHLSNSKLAILSVANMALVLILLIWRMIQSIFLGPLRFRERERLHLRARDAVIESCIAISVFREDFDTMFAALVVALLLYKSIHWLANDRVEYLEEQPLAPRRAHIRTVCLLILLSILDTLLSAKVITYVIQKTGKTMVVLFAFEFTVLAIDIIGAFIRYLFLIIDMSMDGRWDNKSMFSFYAELLSDLSQLIVCVLFALYLQFNYSFPYYIMRELYVTFWKFQRRFTEFLRYRQIIATMDERFPDATEEELNEGDRTCIICRDEMQAAKKLPCGHMFHARCLQNWLKRQLTCPTCRAPIQDVTTSSNGNRNNNAQNNNNNNPNQNNVPVPNGNQQQARGAQNPADAGARLLNMAYQRWNQFVVEAGVGARRQAQNMQPQQPQQQRAQQNNHLNGHVFLHGPNAIAHMELRARRRGAWPNQAGGQFPMQFAQDHPAGNPIPANQQPLMPDGSSNQPGTQRPMSSGNARNNTGQASSSSQPPMQGDGSRPPSYTNLPYPQQGDIGRRLPLERLLAVQEQLRWLMDEVQELIIDATAEPVPDPIGQIIPPTNTSLTATDVNISPSQGQPSISQTQSSETHQEISTEASQGQASSSTSTNNQTTNDSNVSSSQVEGQSERVSAERSEADEVRERRIQSLERRAQG